MTFFKKEHWAQLLAWIVLLIGLGVLFGWQTDVMWLKRPIQNSLAMNPTTALLLVIVAVILLIRLRSKKNRVATISFKALLSFVALVALLRLIDIGSDWTVHVDQILFAGRLAMPDEVGRVPRLSLIGSLNFLLVAVALYYFKMQKFRQAIFAQSLSVGILMTSLYSLMGYVFKIPEFGRDVPEFSLAPHTVVAFFMLGFSFLLGNSQRGLMKQLTSPYSGSTLARKLIPFMIVLPLLIGFLVLHFETTGVVSMHLGVTLLVLGLILSTIVFTVLNTNALNRKDAHQRWSENRIRATNSELNRANHEIAASNEEIQAAMEEVSATNDALEASNENLKITNTKLNEAQEQIQHQAAEIIHYKDQQLSEYRNNLDIIFSNTQEGILLLDAKGTVVLFNKTFEKFFHNVGGYKPRTGVSLLDVVLPARKEIAQGLFNRTLAGETIQTEASFATKEGHIIIHQLRYEPVHQFGKITHVIIISQDITDSKRQAALVTQQEEALQESEEKFRALVEYSGDIFSVLGLDGTVLYASPSLTRVLGYSPAEIQTHIGGDFVHPDDVQAYQRKFSEAIEEPGKPVYVTCRARHKLNHWLWMEGTLINVSKIGKVHGVIATFHDITHQKEYETNITAIAREFSGLIENSNVPIFGVDRNGYINEWNAVMGQLTKYNKNEVLTKRWGTELVESSHHQKVLALLSTVLEGNSINNVELPIVTKDQDHLTLLLSISPRYDQENQIKGAIIVGQNITELSNYRKGLENMVEARTRELNDALKKEKDLVEMKSKFVSMASHEFRTPLSTISLATGFLRRYRERITPEMLDDKLNDIVRQIDHMNFLLEDVLTVGKTEAGSVQVNLSEIKLREFFGGIATEVHQSTAQTHHVNVSFNIEREAIQTDPRMMRIIIVNLLTNGIKFSPGNESVEMKVALKGKTLKLQVTDHGLGIPEDDRAKLFQSFHRGSNTSAIPGTGLGLSIVRKTVDLLKGSIQLTSKLNEGTTFIVFIPVL